MSIFTKTPQVKTPKNTFDLSHDRKFAMQMGSLVPVLCMEVLPSDQIRINTSQLMRFAPMIAPVMHQINTYTHYFFVPNRIVWDGWDNFISDPETTRVFPTLAYTANKDDLISELPLLDYLGLPGTSADGGPTPSTQIVSAIPMAAYQMIYNEYYRDQNLIDEVDFQLNDATNSANADLFLLRTRAWQHDYFTSALPWTQRGPEATIPVGAIEFEATGTNDVLRNPTTGAPFAVANTIDTDASGNVRSGGVLASLDNSANLAISNTNSTIIDLRRAFKLQEWLETSARGGARYTETIQAHFGITPQDSRLQRPEFLGGTRSAVSISEVLQTSSNASEPTPQGNMAGHGISAAGGNSITYRAQEHGYIIALQSVLPKTAYSQGIPKHFLKFDKYDYFWTQFQHIGEQPIQNKELFVADDGSNDETFGYTPRYAEYKFINSSIHGAFRTSLNYWHMAREFANRPSLNATFVSANPTKRIFAVEDPAVEDLYVHLHHRISAKRPMAYFGQPKM